MKGTLQIPKEKQECKDGSCGHAHEVEIEIPEIKPAPASIVAEAVPAPVPEPPATSNHDHSHEIQTNHKELAELMPGGTNFAKCADGSCGSPLIQNSKLTKNFKGCTNCGSNAVPKKNEFCPTCGNKPDESDEWEDSDIDSEKIGDEED